MRLLFITLLFASCCTFSVEQAPEENEQPGSELCAQACEVLEDFDCKLSYDVVDNGQVLSCLDRCIKEHRDGYFWNTECLINISKCEDINDKCRSIYKAYLQ